MKLLALDTSAAHCAAALLDGDRIVASTTEPMDRGQGERLMPLAVSLLNRTALVWEDLEAIAVGIGPGNFTGIRIAVSAARGLALALEIPAIGVSTFEAMALGIDGPLLITIDARRDRLYVQGFGGVDLTPRLIELTGVPSLVVPSDTCVIGSQASQVAALLGLSRATAMDHPPPEAFARVAAGRAGPHDRPAPLYLRPADATPPVEPPPKILDAS